MWMYEVEVTNIIFLKLYSDLPERFDLSMITEDVVGGVSDHRSLCDVLLMR
jgi:hypothetical protein